MKRVWVIGATSAIAEHTARCFAKDKACLLLVGRNQDRLSEIAADLNVRGASEVIVQAMNVSDASIHSSAVEQAWKHWNGFDVVLIAYGVLPDQKECEISFQKTRDVLEVNLISTISWLTEIANRMERERMGVLAVISSVAGDRGRGSNYVYGTTKAALNTFLEGLRHRLFTANVHVLTIKPGFVDTPMTSTLRKGPLFASAKAVGKIVHRAIVRKKSVIYAPSFWRPIMFLVRNLPRRIFLKTQL